MPWTRRVTGRGLARASALAHLQWFARGGVGAVFGFQWDDDPERRRRGRGQLLHVRSLLLKTASRRTIDGLNGIEGRRGEAREALSERAASLCVHVHSPFLRVASAPRVPHGARTRGRPCPRRVGDTARRPRADTRPPSRDRHTSPVRKSTGRTPTKDARHDTAPRAFQERAGTAPARSTHTKRAPSHAPRVWTRLSVGGRRTLPAGSAWCAPGQPHRQELEQPGDANDERRWAPAPPPSPRRPSPTWNCPSPTRSALLIVSPSRDAGPVDVDEAELHASTCSGAARRIRETTCCTTISFGERPRSWRMMIGSPWKATTSMMRSGVPEAEEGATDEAIG